VRLAEGLFVDDEIVLQLDLEPGRNADAVLAAEALVAWIEAAQEASAVMGLSGDLRVELVSAEPACLKLRTVFRFVEDRLIGPPAHALQDFPRLKKLVVATVIGAPLGLTAIITEHSIYPDHPEGISEASKQEYDQLQQAAAASPAVRDKVKRFYRKLERDPAITRVSIGASGERRAIIEIPREQFAERGGLWDPEVAPLPTRAQHARWEVVVTHPALLSKPQAWRFVRDGLPFSAVMADQRFLAAIKDGTLPIHVQEGVTMVVELEWQERLEGQAWETVPRSRKITRVVSPTPGKL
jgi:hypothetical protein